MLEPNLTLEGPVSQQAYYDQSGIRVVNVSQISAHYVRRWFLIDFVSCLPVGYISYFSSDGTIGDQFKAAKVLRLFRLAKMLRLARVLRILRKYEEKINLVSTKRFEYRPS